MLGGGGKNGTSGSRGGLPDSPCSGSLSGSSHASFRRRGVDGPVLRGRWSHGRIGSTSSSVRFNSYCDTGSKNSRLARWNESARGTLTERDRGFGRRMVDVLAASGGGHRLSHSLYASVYCFSQRQKYLGNTSISRHTKVQTTHKFSTLRSMYNKYSSNSRNDS